MRLVGRWLRELRQLASEDGADEGGWLSGPVHQDVRGQAFVGILAMQDYGVAVEAIAYERRRCADPATTVILKDTGRSLDLEACPWILSPIADVGDLACEASVARIP